MGKKAPKKAKNNEKSQKSLYLENSLWGQIETKAESEGRSLNNFLENYLKRNFAA